MPEAEKQMWGVLFRAGRIKKSPLYLVGGIIKKKGIYPRHPIFINLKSNTMKNTAQR